MGASNPIPYQGHEQDPDALCLCGSGLKHRRCCKKASTGKVALGPVFTRRPGQAKVKLLTPVQFIAFQKAAKAKHEALIKAAKKAGKPIEGPIGCEPRHYRSGDR